MDSRHLRKVGLSLAVLLGVGASAFMLAPRAKADTWDKMTLLTFKEPVQVMNTVLQPGTYMFRLIDWERHTVVITNGDRSKPYGIVFATAAYRVFPTDKAQVTFWETPPGAMKAVRYWWYPGDNYGQEFSYPSNLRQVAAVTQAPAPQQAEVAPAPQPAAPPEPAPAAAESEQQTQTQQQSAETEQQSQAPVEIAQNNPPPAPAPAPAQPDQSAQQPQQSQQTLPQTASPYPLIGLAGLLSLGSFFGLRARVNR